jgi:DeoR family fructose operon transcriptional repressor
VTTGRSIEAQLRRDELLAALKRDGRVRLEAAAAALGVSPMTVRRDLDELDAEGLLRRVRGGAIAALDARPFSERRVANLAAKSIIASKAARLVPHTGAVAIDASTTAGGLAGRIADSDQLTVVTNSFDNFVSLGQQKSAVPILTGGEIDPQTGSFVGLIACQSASSVLYSRFFASANSIDVANGSSEVSLSEMQVKRAFAERSQEIVLVVDSSKLDRQSVSMGFAWDEVAFLVTELDPTDARLHAYRDLVEVL